MFRTHIRAVTVGIKSVQFVIEEWRSEPFYLSRIEVPWYAEPKLHSGFRCYVTIDRLALTIADLNIREWSLIR